MSVFYGVRKGYSQGVFESWEEAKEQVNGFPGAVFKKFSSYDEAEDFAFPSNQPQRDSTSEQPGFTAFVDGSFMEIHGLPVGGWGVVLLKDGEVLLEGFGPVRSGLEMRNITGEIVSVEQAIKVAAGLGVESLTIYHDYEGLGRWPDGDWKAKNRRVEEYISFVNEMRKKVDVRFEKIKGHSNIKYNDRADELAALGAKSDDSIIKKYT